MLTKLPLLLKLPFHKLKRHTLLLWMLTTFQMTNNLRRLKLKLLLMLTGLRVTNTNSMLLVTAQLQMPLLTLLVHKQH